MFLNCRFCSFSSSSSVLFVCVVLNVSFNFKLGISYSLTATRAINRFSHIDNYFKKQLHMLKEFSGKIFVSLDVKRSLKGSDAVNAKIVICNI